VLAWVLGDQLEAPMTRTRSWDITTRILKMERVQAQHVIEQATQPWMTSQLPPPSYGEGVKLAITWLLGDSTSLPIDPKALVSTTLIVGRVDEPPVRSSKSNSAGRARYCQDHTGAELQSLWRDRITA
jgi:hypothetical protein